MFLLLFDFYCFINVKFCVADRFDFIDNFNAAFSAYANTGAGRNYVFKAWVAPVPAEIMSSRLGLPEYLTDVACSPPVPSGE